MKLRTLLLAAALAAAPLASGEDSFQGALQRTSTPHASLYSFADLYRLTVSGTGRWDASTGGARVNLTVGDVKLTAVWNQAAPLAAIDVGGTLLSTPAP